MGGLIMQHRKIFRAFYLLEYLIIAVDYKIMKLALNCKCKKT